MHVLHALERFVLQLEADGRSPHTVAQYKRHVGALVSWLATKNLSCDVEAIDHETIARFLASSTARTKADGAAKMPTSMNALRTSVRCFFMFACRAGYLDADPARLVRRARCAPPPPRALTDAEEAKLLEAARAATGPEAERDLALLQFMLATGVRVSSAVALLLEDLDLEEGVAVVRRAKGGRAYRVWLCEPVRERLAHYIAGRTHGPAFPARHGGLMNTRHFQRRFAELRNGASLPSGVTLHSLRHRFAMGVYGRTGDILVVKAALGHSSIISTLVYARPDEARVRRAVAMPMDH